MKRCSEFFDCLFYGVYTEYAKKEKDAQSSAAAVVGALWAMNLSAIAMTIPLFFRMTDFPTNKYGFVILVIAFQILAYCMYARRKMVYIDKVREKWTAKTDRTKVWIRALIVGYIPVTVAIFFGLAIYLGTQK